METRDKFQPLSGVNNRWLATASPAAAHDSCYPHAKIENLGIRLGGRTSNTILAAYRLLRVAPLLLLLPLQSVAGLFLSGAPLRCHRYRVFHPFLGPRCPAGASESDAPIVTPGADLLELCDVTAGATTNGRTWA